MLCLRHHGCDDVLRSLATSARAQHETAATDQDIVPVPQQAYDLGGVLAPQAEQARAALLNICYRMLSILLGEDSKDALQARRQELSGRLCLRSYPSAEGLPSLRLGGHCDATLMTLLCMSALAVCVICARLTT